MTDINWDRFMNSHGHIELVECFLATYPWCENSEPAKKYLWSIMDLQPIRSRQAAAIAIATAARIAEDEKDD